MRLAILVLVFLLAACMVGPTPSAVDPDTYYITAGRGIAIGGFPEAQRMALEEARAFCEEQGRGMTVVSETAEIDWLKGGKSTLTFRCE